MQKRLISTETMTSRCKDGLKKFIHHRVKDRTKKPFEEFTQEYFISVLTPEDVTEAIKYVERLYKNYYKINVEVYLTTKTIVALFD